MHVIKRYSRPRSSGLKLSAIYVDETCRKLYMDLDEGKYVAERIPPGLPCHEEWHCHGDEPTLTVSHGTDERRFRMTPCETYPFTDDPAQFVFRDFDSDGAEFYHNSVSYDHVKAFFRELHEDHYPLNISECALTDTDLTLVFGYYEGIHMRMEKIEVNRALRCKTYQKDGIDAEQWGAPTTTDLFTVSGLLAGLKNLIQDGEETTRAWASLPPEVTFIPQEASVRSRNTITFDALP